MNDMQIPVVNKRYEKLQYIYVSEKSFNRAYSFIYKVFRTMVAEISLILSIHGPRIQSNKNLMVVEISYNSTKVFADHKTHLY